MGAHSDHDRSISDTGRAVCIAVALGMLVAGWALIVMLLVYLVIRP